MLLKKVITMDEAVSAYEKALREADVDAASIKKVKEFHEKMVESVRWF